MAGLMDELIDKLDEEQKRDSGFGRMAEGNRNGDKQVDEHVFGDYCDAFKEFCKSRE